MSGKTNDVTDLVELARARPHTAQGQQAFTALYDRFVRPLARTLVRQTATFHPRPAETDLEDIVQAAMTSALTRLSTFDPGKASFFTWLCTIGRNEALAWLDRRRKDSRRHAFSQDDQDAPQVAFPHEVRIEGLAFHRELFSGIAAAAATLKNRTHRLVVGLVYLGWIDGLDEMARLLDENYNTLKSAYRRGSHDLLFALEEDQDALFVEMARRVLEVNKEAGAARGLCAADPQILADLADRTDRELVAQVLLGGRSLGTVASALDLKAPAARLRLESAVDLLVAAVARRLREGE